MITLPSGTAIYMVLTRPIIIKHHKTGDRVYLQITFPVTLNSKMVISPGTYVEGIIEKVGKVDRDKEVAKLKLSSVKMILSNGYTVAISDPLELVPATMASMRQLQANGRQVPVFAATATPTLPAPTVPTLGNGLRNAFIGIAVGSVAAMVLLLALSHHSRETIMDAGTPLQMVLASPLALDEERVTDAVRLYHPGTVPVAVVAPVKRRVVDTYNTPEPTQCYTPPTPDEPDRTIPGSGVPAHDGIPAVPDVVIPGKKGDPGGWHPCP